MQWSFSRICHFTNGDGLAFTHDWRLVVLSYVIASAGSYAALAMAERLRQKSSAASGLWQAGSAMTLGGSIWSMHLVAMLAMQIEVPLSYDFVGTAASLLLAIGSVAVGLSIARRGRLSPGRLLAAGTVIGMGVAVMHYMGMAALLFPGSIGYTPVLWALSVLIAIAASVVALMLALKLRPDWRYRTAAALIMGFAICGMHYTGMAATVFTPDPGRTASGGMPAGLIAAAVAGVTLALIMAAMVLAGADKRLAAAKDLLAETGRRSAAEIAAVESERAMLDRDLSLTRHSAEMEKSIQGLLATVFSLVETPIAIVTTNGRIVICNPNFDLLVGDKPGALVGRLLLDLVEVTDRARLLQELSGAVAPASKNAGAGSLEAVIRRSDGSGLSRSLVLAAATQPELQRFRIVMVTSRAGDGRVRAATKLRFIHLDEVRALLGQEWDAIAVRVLAAAETVIHRHLRADDTFRRTPDMGFVIAFGETTELEATQRSALMASEIMTSLLEAGEDAETAELSRLTVSVPLADGADALERTLRELEDGEAGRGRPTELPGCIFDRVQDCQRGSFIGWMVNASASTARDAGLPSLSNYDDLALRGLAEQADRLRAFSSGEELFIRLAFASFENRASADRVVGSLRGLDGAIRERLVVLLADVPRGVHVSRMQDAAARLQVVCARVGLSLADLELPGFDLAVFKAPVVAVDGLHWEEAFPAARVEKLALGLRLKRARLLVTRVPSVSVARSLRAKGVDYVSLVAEPRRNAAAGARLEMQVG